MGSFGSGYRRRKRPTVDDYPCLDIRQLQRAGCLVPGHSHRTELIHETHTESLTTKTTLENTLVITYHYGNNNANNVTFKFRFEQTPCNYGGKRSFFLCPHCGRRICLIYCIDKWGCRHCHNLTYPCQGEKAEDRYDRQANKIREMLGWKKGILNPTGNKQKGMHEDRFNRLALKHDRYASKVLDSMCKTFNIVF